MNEQEGYSDGRASPRRWRRYPKYKPSGVEWLGEVPEGWEILPIKRIVRIKITDGPHETPEFFENGVPFISAEAIKDNKIDFSLMRGYISNELHEIYKKKASPQKNDILFVKSGATTGNVAKVVDDIEFDIWSPLALIRSDSYKVLPDYLFSLIQSIEFRKQVEMSWSFGTQQNIGMNVIEKLMCTIPPLPEQHAIAAFLDHETVRIDALIEKKKRQIELLQEKRSALISNAVTKGLDPNAKMKNSGIEWLGEVLEGWIVTPLKYLTIEQLKYGSNDATTSNNKNFPRYVRITDINSNGTLRDETFLSLPEYIAREFILQTGDILFARSGATVGKSFIYDESWGRCCYAGYLVRFRSDKRKILPYFIYYFTNSRNYWDWISIVNIQSTIQNVSGDKYANLEIPLPPLSEQNVIVAFVDRETAQIDGIIEKINGSLEKLNEYRIALISAAVTGKIDVRQEIHA